ESGSTVISYSPDGGKTWNSYLGFPDLIKNYLTINCAAVDGNSVWMGGTGGIVILAGSTGSSWSYPANNGLENKRLESIIALTGSGEHLIAVSSLNNIYYSRDNAQNWNPYNADAGLPANATYYFSASHIGNTFFIGSSAGIFA